MHDAHTRPANTTTERCNSQARVRGPTGGTRDTGNSTAATRTAQQQERDCGDTARGVHVAAHGPGARAATPAGDNTPAAMTAARPPPHSRWDELPHRANPGLCSRRSHEYTRQPYRPAAAPGQAPADSMPRIPQLPAHTQSSGAH